MCRRILAFITTRPWVLRLANMTVIDCPECGRLNPYRATEPSGSEFGRPMECHACQALLPASEGTGQR